MTAYCFCKKELRGCSVEHAMQSGMSSSSVWVGSKKHSLKSFFSRSICRLLASRLHQLSNG